MDFELIGCGVIDKSSVSDGRRKNGSIAEKRLQNIAQKFLENLRVAKLVPRQSAKRTNDNSPALQCWERNMKIV